MLKLQYTDGSQKGVWLIEPKQKLGADRKNDLVMAGSDIGDFHAEIHVQGDSLRLEPLGGHSCQINGNRIAGATPIKLGDKIRIGSVELLVLDPRQQKAPAKPAAKPAGSGGWALIAQQSGMNNKRWPIKGTMVIGRAADCDISIAYDRMSRKHAELKETGGNLSVRDLDSSNGTFVNDRQVKEETRLKAGDKVRFDMLAFVVDGPKEDINKTVVRPAIDLAAIQQQAKAQKKAAPKAARPATGKPQPRQVVEKAVEASPASDAGLPVMLIVGIVAAVVLIGAAAWYFLA
ncbi:MAG TPA: FHA domain-containing protein [Pseudomonadales bacterium]